MCSCEWHLYYRSNHQVELRIDNEQHKFMPQPGFTTLTTKIVKVVNANNTLENYHFSEGEYKEFVRKFTSFDKIPHICEHVPFNLHEAYRIPENVGPVTYYEDQLTNTVVRVEDLNVYWKDSE